MKKIVLVILSLFILPVIFLVSGCGKTDLSNLKSSFKDVVSDCEYVRFENDKLLIDYAGFKIDNRSYVQELIVKDGPYYNINKLNSVLENSLAFTYSYIDLCSDKNWNVPNEIANTTYEDIKGLKKSITRLDELVLDLANNARFYYNYTSFDSMNLNDLYKLMNQYVIVISNSLKVSKDIQKIYNSAILKTNIDLNNVELDEFDTNKVLNYIDYIRKSNIVDLTEVYVNSYLNNDQLINSLIKSDSGSYNQINLNYNGYSSNVIELKRDISLAAAKIRADANKEEFFNASIEMSNAISSLNNEYIKYVAVKDKINFATARRSDDNIHNMYIDIISSYDSKVINCSNLINHVLQIIA